MSHSVALLPFLKVQLYCSTNLSKKVLIGKNKIKNEQDIKSKRCSNKSKKKERSEQKWSNGMAKSSHHHVDVHHLNSSSLNYRFMFFS